MTGTRYSLRRYSGCNLHWYALDPDRGRRGVYDPPSRWNRRKIYIPRDQEQPTSRRYGTDLYGPYVWMINDCGWEWLATRPGVQYISPLRRTFEALHDHVHTKHDREGRFYVFQPAKRAVIRALSRVARRPALELDERWETNLFPGANPYLIKVTLPAFETDARVINLLHDRESPRTAPTALWPGRNHNSCRVTWIERASNSTLARQQAERAARAAFGTLGGTHWDAPQKVKVHA